MKKKTNVSSKFTNPISIERNLQIVESDLVLCIANVLHVIACSTQNVLQNCNGEISDFELTDEKGP